MLQIFTEMENEPLVRPDSHNMNYDGSSASANLNSAEGGNMLGGGSGRGGGDDAEGIINGDKADPGGNARSILEKFHEDALQQVIKHFIL